MRDSRFAHLLGIIAVALVATAVVAVPIAARSAGTETPKQFLTRLAAALRKGDSAFLLHRLNPAVLDRYGEPLCRGFVLTLKDPTAKIVVHDVGPPEPYDYASDGESTTVPKTRSVTVERTSDGATSTQTVHVALRGHQLTWFTMCHPTGADAVARALALYTGTYTGTWRDTHFNVGGDMKVVVAIDAVAQTLSIELTFTGPLFGATAPSTEQLAPLSIDIAQFGAPVTGTSKVFGPYTVTYDAAGKVTVQMPQCPPGSCTLSGTLKPGTFSGSVSVDLRDGTKSQGTVELKKQ